MENSDPHEPLKGLEYRLPILVGLTLLTRLFLTTLADFSYEPSYYVATAKHGWANAFYTMVISTQGPANTLFLKTWISLSQSVLWIKIYALLLSSLSVWLAWVCAKKWANQNRAFWITLSYSLFPIVLQTSFSPRYEPILLCCIWLHLSYLHDLLFSPKPTFKTYLGYVLPLLIGTGAFALFLFFSLSSLMVLFFFWKKPWGQKILFIAGVGLLLLPLAFLYAWIARNLSQPGQGPPSFSIGGLVKQLMEIAVGLLLGYHRNWYTSDSISLLGKLIFIILALGIGFGGLFSFKHLKSKILLLLCLFTFGTCLSIGVLKGLSLHPKYLVWTIPLLLVLPGLSLPEKKGLTPFFSLLAVCGLGSACLMGLALNRFPNTLHATTKASQILKKGETLWVYPASFSGIPETHFPNMKVRGIPHQHDYFKDAWGLPITKIQVQKFIQKQSHQKRLLLFLGQGEKPYTDRYGWLMAALKEKWPVHTLMLFAEDNFFQPRALLVCVQIQAGACPPEEKPSYPPQ